MNTNIYCWSYHAQFFLEWETVHIKIVEKIKTHILYATKFLIRTICEILWKNMGKPDRP